MFDQKIVVVTGGGRGLGRNISLEFAKQGATVVVAGRTMIPLEETVQEIEKRGGLAVPVQFDIGNQESVENGAAQILEKFGKVDVLVNNAAVGGPSAPLWQLDLKDWQETMDINVTGPFLCCRAFLPSMIENKSGSIILIGSMSGKRPLINRTAYTTSKIALVGLARTLAWEIGSYGLRVNVISPGPMEGDRLKWVFETQAEQQGITFEEARNNMVAASPLNRFVDTQDVADLAVFLASDKGKSTTGEDINVSSGIVMY